jgi:exodeoxyribonuclease VII small subunit
MPTKTTTEMSFEDRFIELENVVAQLESGNLPLEQSLQLAQRGQELAAQCEVLLKNAELKLEELSAARAPEQVQEDLFTDAVDEQ